MPKLPHHDLEAIHSDVSGEIATVTAKATPTASDFVLIEDAAAANAKKRITIGDLSITESQISDLDHTDTAAIHDNVAAEISALSGKTTPSSGDFLILEDSAASFAKKSVTYGNIIANLNANGTIFSIGALSIGQALVASSASSIAGADSFSTAKSVTPTDLGTASGTININASTSNVFDLIVNGAATIAAPTNQVDGQTIILRVRQDVTGSRAVTFNAVWDFGDDGAPDTSADAANSLMIVSGVSDGTNIFVSAKKGFTNT